MSKIDWMLSPARTGGPAATLEAVADMPQLYRSA
jgi:hypothetical protein